MSHITWLRVKIFFSTLETEHTNTRRNMQECAPRMISFEFLMNLTYILQNTLCAMCIIKKFLPEAFRRLCLQKDESVLKGIMMKWLSKEIIWIFVKWWKKNLCNHHHINYRNITKKPLLLICQLTFYDSSIFLYHCKGWMEKFLQSLYLLKIPKRA